MNTSVPRYIDLFQYSMLALPLAFAGLPLYIHVPDFYTSSFGMNMGMMGLILLSVRFFDAVQDPVIGYISDKHPAGRFAIMLSGSCMLVAGMAALFHGPRLSIPIAVWFTLFMVLATTGFSIVTINLNMIGGFWHKNPAHRTQISAWREAFALIGLLIASVVPVALQRYHSTEISYEILFWIFFILIVSAFILFARFMRLTSAGQLIASARTQKGFSFMSIILGPDKKFFAVCFLTHVAAALPGVLVLFFIRDYLEAGALSGLFLFLYFISGAVLINGWTKLSHRIGKYKTWLSSMFLSAGCFIWAFALQPGDAIAYGIICVLSGTALGADLALPPSILADRVSQQNAEGEATQYYALLAFIPKTSIALVSGFSFLILDWSGFVPGSQNDPDALKTLLILYALLPCLIKLMAAGLLWMILKQERNNYEYIERNTHHGIADVI